MRPKTTTETVHAGPLSDCPICLSPAGILVRWKVPGDITSGYDLVPCVCAQGAQAHVERVAVAARLSGLGGLERHTFTSFNAARQKQGYDAARHFAVHAEPPFLYFGGGTGTGKSRLLCAIGNHVLALGVRSVRYTTAPGVVVPGVGNASDVSRRYDDLLDCGILLLDDLGAERDTPYAQERVWSLIDYRYARRMPTAIASNVPRKDLGDRLASRLGDVKLVKAINMAGEDYRKSEDRRQEDDPWNG